MAMKLINKEAGGLLLSCSCSAAVSQSEGRFLEIVTKGARQAGRGAHVLATRSAAEDHPILPTYPEGRYLIACLVGVE